ncbi:hypothetical protein ScPMuIL_014985 [Solemya velum]
MHKRQRSDFGVPTSNMARTCKSCGCVCECCSSHHSSLDLHQQIEELQSQLRSSSIHISYIEHELMDSKCAADFEVLKLKDELAKLRDRYERLFESHKKMQKVNHNLEDKLLKVVNTFEGNKTSLQKDMASITSKLVDAKVTICELEDENERYRTDCNLAVQLLQCKPSNFVSHKLSTLPLDLQERLKKHMTPEQVISMEDQPPVRETKLIRVPIPTFPPMAMVYSVNNENKNNILQNSKTDSVPMTLIAKVLSQPEPTRKPRRTYICQKCKRDIVFLDKEVQTVSAREGDRGCFLSQSGVKVHRNAGRPRTSSSSTETEI